jgi:hypothetical protein
MRYYAAWLCRFVSVDPLQFKYPEYTPFQYSSNNPVTMIDLDGAEGVEPEEQKGKVINAHKTKMAEAEIKVNNINNAINELKNNKPDKLDKEAMATYKGNLGDIKKQLQSAKTTLRITTEDYNEVENNLNEYAYYDPEGYAQLSNYADAAGNPIDIYVRIDHSLKINKDGWQLDYGNFGNVEYTAIVDDLGNMTNIRTEMYGQNTIVINLAKGGYASTIAHEKGHLDFDFYRGAEDVAYRTANPNYNHSRHDIGDPSGIAADDATNAYKNKQRIIDVTGNFFRGKKRKTISL